MKSLLTIVFLCISLDALPCICAPQSTPIATDFVALVEITELAPGVGYTRANGDAKIRIIELFKGNPETTLFEPGYRTDCALGLQTGEQWLLFGIRRNDHIEIGSCLNSVRYRAAGGERNWKYYSGFAVLDRVRQSLGIIEVTTPEKVIFYPDGKKEIEQSFSKGKLNGVRNIYYPSGQLYVTEDFTKGERKSFRKLYSPSGQLIIDTRYKKGLKTKIINYNDTGYRAPFLIGEAKGYVWLKRLPRTEEMYRKALDSLKKINTTFPTLIEEFREGILFRRETFYAAGKLSDKFYFDRRRKISEWWLYNNDIFNPWPLGQLRLHSRRDHIKNMYYAEETDRLGNKNEIEKVCEDCKLKNTPALNAIPEVIYLK